MNLTKEKYNDVSNWSYKKKLKLNSILYHYTWNNMFTQLLLNNNRNKEIENYINNELKNLDDPTKLYPKRDYIFRAFSLTPKTRIKVVILGQDPYFNSINFNNNRLCQATGLSFSVPHGFTIPSSLNNMYNNLIKFNHIKQKPNHGCLEYWAYQGCLLLNTSLTVIDNNRNCHSDIWKSFTDDIIKYINDNIDFVVFVLWGKESFKKVNLINLNKHKIIVSSHPSGLSCDKKMGNHPSFNEVNHFGLINDYLKEKNIIPIDWKL